MRGTIGMKALGMQIGNAGDGATLKQDQAIRRWLILFGPQVISQAAQVVARRGPSDWSSDWRSSPGTSSCCRRPRRARPSRATRTSSRTRWSSRPPEPRARPGRQRGSGDPPELAVERPQPAVHRPVDRPVQLVIARMDRRIRVADLGGPDHRGRRGRRRPGGSRGRRRRRSPRPGPTSRGCGRGSPAARRRPP